MVLPAWVGRELVIDEKTGFGERGWGYIEMDVVPGRGRRSLEIVGVARET